MAEKSSREKKPNPGSDEAIKQGCKCPVLDNAHGRGCDWGEGIFWINELCPIHVDSRDSSYS